MSRVDDDLAEALRESEEAAPAVAPVVPRQEPPGPSRRSLGLLAALLVMGGGILTLVFTSFENAAIYSKGVDEVVGSEQALKERTVRVQGTLVKGSLVRREEPCEYRFRIQKNGSELDVRYPQCVVPDTFRDVPNMDVEVTATGVLADDGHFQASEIMAKCPSKYEMKERAAGGEQAPHGEIIPAGPAARPAY